MRVFVSSLFIFLAVFFNYGVNDFNRVVHAESVSTPINLGFEPHDTAIDPNKPVIYMTKLGSKTLYAVNYATGVISTLALPYPSERLELHNDKLYVTQHKMSHDWYNFENYLGAIAEVDTKEFKVDDVMDVNTDPYDIAIDDNGYIYISPGSGQWSEMKVYSLKDKVEIPNPSHTTMRAQSYIYYNPETSKVYTIDTDTSPRDVDAFEVKNGIIQSEYDSPYHGDYPLEPFAKISPDGLSMYNNSGVVFDLATFKAGDMHFSFDLGDSYNDYAFDLKDKLTFAGNVDGGIDVYKYGTDEHLYSIKSNLNVKKLYFQDGLVAIYTDSKGKNYVEYIRDYGPEAFKFLEGVTISRSNDGDIHYNDFYHSVKNVPIESVFKLAFNQPITLKDATKISVKGPDGFLEIHNEVADDVLTIKPELFKGDTTYTLTIKKEAVSGYVGMQLPNDIEMEFQTEGVPTGWQQINEKWYYYSPITGKKVTGWNQISGTWYFFNEYGEMQTGWLTLRDKRYYLDKSGAMKTGWLKSNSKWYYLDESGAMKTGWLKLDNTWYYLNETGTMKTGWLKSGNTWYYLNEGGAMVTGWLKLGNTWYYLNEGGAMVTGWLSLDNAWYYFYGSGEMAYNTRIDGYKLGSNGAWIR